MFAGAYAPAQRGQKLEEGCPEHAIEHKRVELTPSAGPGIGMARHRQTAA